VSIFDSQDCLEFVPLGLQPWEGHVKRAAHLPRHLFGAHCTGGSFGASMGGMAERMNLLPALIPEVRHLLSVSTPSHWPTTPPFGQTLLVHATLRALIPLPFLLQKPRTAPSRTAPGTPLWVLPIARPRPEPNSQTNTKPPSHVTSSLASVDARASAKTDSPLRGLDTSSLAPGILPAATEGASQEQSIFTGGHEGGDTDVDEYDDDADDVIIVGPGPTHEAKVVKVRALCRQASPHLGDG
jgi:hypothetical protein